MSTLAPARACTPTAPSSATLEVDLGAVAANTELLASRTRAALMAVVKADGFGHGAVDVARTALAHGATSLGVTSVGEALALRAAGLTAPILSWLNPVHADLTTAVRAGVDLAVPDVAHLTAVRAAARRAGRRVDVHLQADVGMARDGASPQEWPELCRAAREAEAAGEVRVVGVMGHLGCAAEPQHPANVADRARFHAAVRDAYLVLDGRTDGPRRLTRHLAATAATLTDPASHLDLVRVGAGIVGIDPSGSTALHPALRLTAPVVSVRDVPAGTRVGYGSDHTTDRATRLALLPVGYADGVPRAASGRGQVTLDGRRCRVVGLVSMDQVVVDVGPLQVRPGDVAVVIGDGSRGEPTVTEWAAWASTIEHEVVTGFGTRLRRTVLPAPALPTAHPLTPTLTEDAS